MPLLIDTRNVVPEEREDSLHDAFVQAEVPRQVSLTAEAVESTRIDAWMIGDAKVFSPASPGLRVIRTPTLGPLDPIVALCLQDHGIGRFRQEGQQWDLMPGEILMAGPTSPNEFVIHGTTTAFEFPFGSIDLPYETVEKASRQLWASPLLSLVTGHLLALRSQAELISASSGAGDVGTATALLVRALLVTAAEDDRLSRSIMADALLPRIVAYVRQHLTDRNLTPASIAQAHYISVRYLYKLCEGANIRLGDWIIKERLEGARRDLSDPANSAQKIAIIAHRWGFKDASHFSTRFRQAYGISPRELQGHSHRKYRYQL